VNKYAWTERIDDTIWRHGTYDSIRECVDEALECGYKLEDKFAIGLVEPYEINYDFADLITERLADDAYEEVGEVAEDWLYKIPKEHMDNLNDRITSIVKGWLEEIKETPSFYKILPIKECTLNEALEEYGERPKGGKVDAE
jgi:hypothetical protein